MDEDEIYEGLGLEPPGEAVPEGGAADAGAPDQSDPEGQTALPEGEPGLAGDEEAEQPGTQPPAQAVPPSPAAAIPQGEALEAAQQAAIDDAYRRAFAGKLDPYTQKPITSKAEFDAYQARYQADQRRAELDRMRQAGVDPAAIQTLIDGHPVIQQAQQVIQAAQAERLRAQAEQAKNWYGDQLKEINALDPEANVTSVDELAARDPEGYRKMMGMVAGGVSLADAYKAIHFDTLAQRRAAAAQQAVRNQAAGKGHLVPSGGQGKAGVEVPGDIKAMYRDLNPDMTDAQIKQEYEKYLRETQ